MEAIGHFSKEDPTLHFDILDKLGKGSYGEVFKGRYLANSEIVAIKVIGVEEGDGGMEPIRKEINILKECNHKNIVKYYGSYFKDDNLWIIMEYCGGGSVRDICQITEKPLIEAHIAIICRETLQGLSYLHSVGKIHRDIKGGNILLNDKGQVKLADFGVSAQLDGTFKKRNTFVGTPYWMAPEVIQESYYDGKADVWSVGITAIEMAELIPPHAQVHPMRVLFKILRDPPPRLSKKNQTNWSSSFHDFVSCCTVKDPNLRMGASQLLSHKFIESAGSTSALVELLEECRLESVRKSDAGQNLRDATVQQSTTRAGGFDADNMNSVVVKDGNTVRQASPFAAMTGTVKKNVPAGYDDAGGTMVYRKDSKDIDSQTKRPPLSHSFSREQLLTVRTMDASIILKDTPPPPASIVSSETVNKKDFGLDSAIQNICRKNSVIQLPFISARSLRPEALLVSDDIYNLNDIIRGLVPPEDTLPSMKLTRYVGNIARTYSYEERGAKVSLDEITAAEHEKQAQNLRICLKTILKI